MMDTQPTNSTAALVGALHGVGLALADLDEAWQRHSDQVPDPDGFAERMAEGYPFPQSLEELAAAYEAWAARATQVAANPPGALAATATAMRQEVAEIRAEMDGERAGWRRDREEWRASPRIHPWG